MTVALQHFGISNPLLSSVKKKLVTTSDLHRTTKTDEAAAMRVCLVSLAKVFFILLQ